MMTMTARQRSAEVQTEEHDRLTAAQAQLEAALQPLAEGDPWELLDEDTWPMIEAAATEAGCHEKQVRDLAAMLEGLRTKDLEPINDVLCTYNGAFVQQLRASPKGITVAYQATINLAGYGPECVPLPWMGRPNVFTALAKPLGTLVEALVGGKRTFVCEHCGRVRPQARSDQRFCSQSHGVMGRRREKKMAAQLTSGL